MRKNTRRCHTIPGQASQATASSRATATATATARVTAIATAIAVTATRARMTTKQATINNKKKATKMAVTIGDSDPQAAASPTVMAIATATPE